MRAALALYEIGDGFLIRFLFFGVGIDSPPAGLEDLAAGDTEIDN